MDNRLWISSEGDMLRGSTVIRPRMSWHYRDIRTPLQLRATLRAGPYAWPGGYALELVAEDGASLCFKCARSEYRLISASIRYKYRDGWRIVGCQIADSEDESVCAHCAALIGGASE